MGFFSRNLPPTPEEQAQADRDAAWRDENSEALTTRSTLRHAFGASRAELDQLVPLTGRQDRIAGT